MLAGRSDGVNAGHVEARGSRPTEGLRQGGLQRRVVLVEPTALALNQERHAPTRVDAFESDELGDDRREFGVLRKRPLARVPRAVEKHERKQNQKGRGDEG